MLVGLLVTDGIVVCVIVSHDLACTRHVLTVFSRKVRTLAQVMLEVRSICFFAEWTRFGGKSLWLRGLVSSIGGFSVRGGCAY